MDHGRWVGSGAWWPWLIALISFAFSAAPPSAKAVSFPPPLALLLLVCAGTFASSAWRLEVRLAALRAQLFALLTCGPAAGAWGASPEVWRRPDKTRFKRAFWSSHLLAPACC